VRRRIFCARGATTFTVNAVLTISWQDCLENAVEPESLMSRQLQGEADGVTPAGFFCSQEEASPIARAACQQPTRSCLIILPDLWSAELRVRALAALSSRASCRASFSSAQVSLQSLMGNAPSTPHYA